MKEHRTNYNIRCPQVRLVEAETNKQLGVWKTNDAVKYARDKGLDLVEVSPNANPPVCKVVEYGKYKFEKDKSKEKVKKPKSKELQFTVNIDAHDYKRLIKKAEDFLFEGDNLHITIKYRGRQMAHKEFGYILASKIREDLVETGRFDKDPVLNGKVIRITVFPLAEKDRKLNEKLI